MKIPTDKLWNYIVPKSGESLDINEAFELKYDLVPKEIIDDGGKRAHYVEVIRFLYSNGYVIARFSEEE